MTTDSKASSKREATNLDAERRRVVGAIFYSRDSAEKALQDLHEHGFGDRKIRAVVLSSDDTGVATDDFDQAPPPRREDKSEDAKEAGGAAVGGGAAALAAVAALGVPAVGPIVLGIALGAILPSLNDDGFSDTDARRFAQGLRAGGVLITVEAGARVPDAIDSLIRNGGYVGDGSKREFAVPAVPGNAHIQPK